ncbi:3-oxoacyl-[acyl-carrier-protein] reductase FabG [compost metagenome]
MAFADLGIRVNAVAPGWIDTRLASGAIHNPDRAPGILARIPAKRWGTADEVAEVVGFLSTAPSRYVTGALVPVDGGFHIG